MQNCIIQKLVNSHWFKDQYDIGPIFKMEFAAFPKATLALLFTAVHDLWLFLLLLTHSPPKVECSIDKWASGQKMKVTFSSERYHQVYQDHFKAIQDFAERLKAHKILPQLLCQLADNGWWVPI
jgi:hypothetical protein